MSQIDRVMVNEDWVVKMPSSFVPFMPEGWLDHSPAVLNFDNLIQHRAKQFKFFDMWGSNPEFKTIVRQARATAVPGVKMYQVVRKLKFLKHRLRALNRRDYADIEKRFYQAKEELDKIQKEVHLDYTNSQLRDQERLALDQFITVKNAYYSYLQQKAKMKFGWVMRALLISIDNKKS